MSNFPKIVGKPRPESKLACMRQAEGKTIRCQSIQYIP